MTGARNAKRAPGIPAGLFPLAASLCLSLSSVAGAGDVAGTIEVPPRRGAQGFSVDLYGKYDRPGEKPAGEKGPGVVSLRPVGGAAPSAPQGPPPVMDQRGASFVPRIVPIPVGGSVRFLNSDPVFHNVFSLSPARKFDLGRYPRGDSRTVTFERAGVVQVFCDIHAEMTGFVVVLESPYFAVLETGGGFRVANVPAGEYEVVAWAEGLSRFETLGRVSVPASGQVSFAAVLGGSD